jgi:hypothetical protein
MSTFTALPSEVKLLIFHNLSLKEKFRQREVCKEWKYLLFDKSLLRNLDFSNTTGKGVTEDVLNMLLSHAQSVVSLDVFNCFELTGTSIIKAAKKGKFRNLESLCISWTRLGDRVLVEVLKGSMGLKNLDILECEISGEAVRCICMAAGHSLLSLRLPGICN